MKQMRRIGGRLHRHAGRGEASFLWPALAGSWVLAAAVALVVMAPGCAGNRLPPYQRGTSCSAERVQAYATAHNMTYEQALAEMRKQDNQLWEKWEAGQAKQPAQQTPAATTPATAASTTTATANVPKAANSPAGGATGTATSVGSIRRYEY